MMNDYPFRPGRIAVRATSYFVKWTFVALLILFIGSSKIPSSPDLAQREETTLGQHEKIHRLDSGPTSSPLTTAMKALLHHMPARRSESVDHDAVNSLVFDPNDIQHGSKDQETLRDLIGHDPLGHNDDTGCYCKSTGRCKRESVHANIAYNCRKGKIEKAVMTSILDEESAQPVPRSDISSNVERDCESLEVPSWEFKCTSPRRKCHCHSMDRTRMKKETESVTAERMSHFRPSDPSQTWKDYKSNERDIEGGTWDEGSGQPDSGSEVNNHFKHDHRPQDRPPRLCRCAPTHQECRYSDTRLSKRRNPHRFQSTNSGINSKPSSGKEYWSNERDAEKGTDPVLENDYGTEDLKKLHRDLKSISCNCNQGSHGCSCVELVPLKQVEVKRKRDMSTTSDAGAHTAVTPKCSCSSKTTKYICGDLRPHIVLHNGEPNLTANLTNALGHKARHISNLRESTIENGEFDDSEDIMEENILRKRWPEKLRTTVSYDEHLGHPSQTIANPARDTTTQICSERWWNRRPNCQPRHTASKAKSDMELNNCVNNELHTSKHIVENNARPKERADRDDLSVPNPSNLNPSARDFISRAKSDTSSLCSDSWYGACYCSTKATDKAKVNLESPVPGHVNLELESPPTLIVARDGPCSKLWRVSTGCLSTHSAISDPVSVQDHPLLRRNDTLLDSITEAKCRGKVGRDRENCEEKHRTGFWIICSVLAVAGICALLLGLLVLHTHLRRKCSRPLLISTEAGHKSGISTPATSVSELQISNVSRPATCVMRRIDEDENDSVRHCTTIDGANDGWTSWIQKQKRSRNTSHKGRCSPTPMTRAPRIPTLKLPQTALATMRKVSGLGSEVESASQGKHTWKDKEKDSTRVKWCSTV